MPIARPGSGSVTQIYEGTDGGARRARGSRLAVTLVIVAVSAIFGGVGTALWVPEKEFEIPDYTNSDRARIRARWREAMEIVFNPRPGPGEIGRASCRERRKSTEGAATRRRRQRDAPQ